MTQAAGVSDDPLHTPAGVDVLEGRKFSCGITPCYTLTCTTVLLNCRLDFDWSDSLNSFPPSNSSCDRKPSCKTHNLINALRSNLCLFI